MGEDDEDDKWISAGERVHSWHIDEFSTAVAFKEQMWILHGGKRAKYGRISKQTQCRYQFSIDLD